jgi:hypothetical protein
MSATTTTASPLSDELLRSRRTAYRKYAELLGDPDATAGDAKSLTQLRTLSAALGRSPAEVDADAKVLRAARQAGERIARGREAAAAQAPALAAVRAYDAETAKVLAERREGYRALYAAYDRHCRAAGAARDAASHLNKLIAQHPELLGHLDRSAE